MVDGQWTIIQRAMQILRVLAIVKTSAVNEVFPILPTVEHPNLCFPNT